MPFADVKQGDQFLLHGRRRLAYEDTRWTEGPFVRELELIYTGTEDGERSLLGICHSTDFPKGMVTAFTNKNI